MTYTMKISRLTIDKLGIRLYDQISAVIAELVANSYDADATLVTIKAPMGCYLAERKNGVVEDLDYKIEVVDDGRGMTPEEVNELYLKVGKERRSDPRQGSVSKKWSRKVMGRKGVGKLAPFGVCRRIELISSGGNLIRGEGADGRRGYLTAHIILQREDMLKDTEADYQPLTGEYDNTLSECTGTRIILSGFERRHVPGIQDFQRQLARRFGLESENWRIVLQDTKKAAGEPDFETTVGEFVIETLENTKLRLQPKTPAHADMSKADAYEVIGPDLNQISELNAGFTFEGKFFPTVGWVAFAKTPYKDDLMAGIRIYCRGKLASQTPVFQLKAGFTGEYDVRSYLVGKLYADWLDEEIDLIQTDRQDILWAHDLGVEFAEFGQKLVKYIARISRDPRRKKAWESFRERSKIEEKVKSEFPKVNQEQIRRDTLEIARSIAQTTREEELSDDAQIESIVQLSFLLGPNMTLDAKLREAAENATNPLPVISNILSVARIAELAGFGRIVNRRIEVIGRLQSLQIDPNVDEMEFQKLIQEAPWLINPQWTPMTSNKSFSTLLVSLNKFLSKKFGTSVSLNDFSIPNVRPDFVLHSHDGLLQLIEIKKPGHALENDEMDRIDQYHRNIEAFLSDSANEPFRKEFSGYHITLVCDGINLTAIQATAFESLKRLHTLEHFGWDAFLLRTKNTHVEFLAEAESQRKSASQG